MRFRRRREPSGYAHASREDDDQLLGRLVREGYIRQTLELTEKAKSILRRDPFTAGDDYWEDWWIDARKAGALVNGTSVTRAAIG